MKPTKEIKRMVSFELSESHIDKIKELQEVLQGNDGTSRTASFKFCIDKTHERYVLGI